MRRNICLGLSVLLFIACGTKKFDEKINSAYSDLVKTFAASSVACDEISTTWHKAIYDNVGPDGYYCSDFNRALRDLSQMFDESGLTDSIKASRRRMEKATSDLQNPPTNRKDCYDDFIELVSEVSQYASMATDPSGSLSSYNTQKNTAEESILRKIKKFNLKYSNIINKEKE